MFTGCGTALVTPFRRNSLSRRTRAQTSNPPPNRSRHRFPRPLRHHRRKSHPNPRRTSTRRRNHRRRIQRPSPSPGRRRRLQHKRSNRTCQRPRIPPRGRHPLRHSLLQQAHARRPLSTLQSHRRSNRDPHNRVQRARPHGHQCRARHANKTRKNRKYRRRKRSLRQHRPDRHNCQPSPRKFRRPLG